MSSAGTTGKKEKSKVFDMILSSPGMSENCKLHFTMKRQNVLILARVIEAGLLDEKEMFEDEILGALPDGSAGEFKQIHEELLKKAGLSEFYEKLKSL